MNNSKVSILVSSCDKYYEAWMPFFTLLDKYWEKCLFPKYLLTETISYSDFGVTTINCQSKEWSNRLIYALERIDTEYILFLLEDFFIMGTVDNEAINRYISFLENDKSMSVIYLKTIAGQNETSSKYPELIKMEAGKKYYMNFQAALWRKKDLMGILKPGLSPWAIEEEFSRSVVSGDFYCVKNSSYTDCTNDVIPYLWALEAGYGICKSKWLWNNKSFFKREGIPCKCESLPTLSKYSYLRSKYFKAIKKRLTFKGYATKR